MFGGGFGDFDLVAYCGFGGVGSFLDDESEDVADRGFYEYGRHAVCVVRDYVAVFFK